jgi:hypothetical protein
MVGQSPFGGNLSTTVIDVPLIPVILTTNAVSTHVTGNGVVFTTTKGTTVFDLTAADQIPYGFRIAWAPFT